MKISIEFDPLSQPEIEKVAKFVNKISASPGPVVEPDNVIKTAVKPVNPFGESPDDLVGSSPTESVSKSVSTSAEQVELDLDGVPWDERIHCQSRNKTQRGRWNRKRKIGHKEHDAIKAELLLAQKGAIVQPESVQQGIVQPERSVQQGIVQPESVQQGIVQPESVSYQQQVLIQQRMDEQQGVIHQENLGLIPRIDSIFGDLVDSGSVNPDLINDTVAYFKPGATSLMDYAGDNVAQQALLDYLLANISNA